MNKMSEIELTGEIEIGTSEEAAYARTNSRIDDIIAHNNDTEGNSELIDIRTGTDGTVYLSAGTAVRSQLKDISDIIDTSFSHDIVNKSANLFNQTAISENAIISNTTGELTENQSYFTTYFIPVDSTNHPSIISTFAFVPSGSQVPTKRAERKWSRLAGYDTSGQFVSGSVSDGQSVYTVTDSNIKYVRIAYMNTYQDRPALSCQIMIEYGTEVNTDLSHYDVYNEGDVESKLKYDSLPSELISQLRQKVYISANDGINSFYSKMLTAYTNGNCDVHISKGEYVYTNALVESIRSSGKRGVPIGNGCRYYFDTGAYISCEYTGDNASDVVGFFSPLDSQNTGSDYEIYNLNILAKNVCYAVHDECDASATPCRHYYENCNIELDNTALGQNGNSISKALGGGLGKYEEVIIKNCVFKATNPSKTSSEQDDASYHGANRSTFTDAKIVIDGCYFENRFRTSNVSVQEPNEKHPQIIYSNNCSGVAVNIPSSWTSYVWNNSVRGEGD